MSCKAALIERTHNGKTWRSLCRSAFGDDDPLMFHVNVVMALTRVVSASTPHISGKCMSKGLLRRTVLQCPECLHVRQNSFGNLLVLLHILNLVKL